MIAGYIGILTSLTEFGDQLIDFGENDEASRCAPGHGDFGGGDGDQ